MSFRGDVELCGLLCETVDVFVPDEIPHLLAVPRADFPLFQRYATPRRPLVAQEELLPPWLYRLPMPPSPLREALRLPRRNVYATVRGQLVRGWIAQQLMKLNAARAAEVDVLLHVDSDAAFVRPLTQGHIVREGRVRLMRTAGEGDTQMHRPWHLAASSMLGLPQRAYHGADYIGNLTIWRRELVRQLLDRIGQVTSSEPFAALAARKDFSEYILYGVYAEHVVGLEHAKHWATPEQLCATVWPGADPAVLDAHLQQMQIEDWQIAIGVQSTVPVSIAHRRRLVSRLSGQSFL